MTPTSEKLAASRDVVIRTRELSKKFGDSIAVDQITMTIPRGSIFGFIGPSGCLLYTSPSPRD